MAPRKLPIDLSTIRVIDDFFNSQLEHIIQGNDIQVFDWTHALNNLDLDIMFQDIQKEMCLDMYIPKNKLKSPITFWNYILHILPLPVRYKLHKINSNGFIHYFDVVHA